MLDHIRCQAHLKPSENLPAAKEESLKEQNDRGRLLLAGDEVRCDPGSQDSLTLLLVGVRDEKKLTASDDWFRIPWPLTATMKDQEKVSAQALIAESPRAGTRPGIPGVLYYPTESCLVLPVDLTIRWTPQSGGTVNFSLWLPGESNALWRVSDVNSSAGSFQSADVRKVLDESRAPVGTTRYILRGEFSRLTAPVVIRFGVLSRESENALNEELEIWRNDRNELRSVIGRAYSYDSRQLYWEAARDYELAHDLAPGSCNLLDLAIQAHQMAGDLEKVAQLQEQRSHLLKKCAER
jgi:hypothetical protein